MHFRKISLSKCSVEDDLELTALEDATILAQASPYCLTLSSLICKTLCQPLCSAFHILVTHQHFKTIDKKASWICTVEVNKMSGAIQEGGEKEDQERAGGIIRRLAFTWDIKRWEGINIKLLGKSKCKLE